MPLHIIKGDQVIVTAGNDKGVIGEVVEVLVKQERVVVKGVHQPQDVYRAQGPAQGRRRVGRPHARMIVHAS